MKKGKTYKSDSAPANTPEAMERIRNCHKKNTDHASNYDISVALDMNEKSVPTLFRPNRKQISGDYVEKLADLWGVLPSYLRGESDFETVIDEWLYNVRQRDIESHRTKEEIVLDYMAAWGYSFTPIYYKDISFAEIKKTWKKMKKCYTDKCEENIKYWFNNRRIKRGEIENSQYRVYYVREINNCETVFRMMNSFDKEKNKCLSATEYIAMIENTFSSLQSTIRLVEKSISPVCDPEPLLSLSFFGCK